MAHRNWVMLESIITMMAFAGQRFKHATLYAEHKSVGFINASAPKTTELTDIVKHYTHYGEWRAVTQGAGALVSPISSRLRT